jgi:spermidine synthase
VIREPLATGLTREWDVTQYVVDTRTPFQHLVIGHTAQGVSLFCDDDRQSTEFSQLTYHEALMVPALLLADRIDRVLVIGSSEGVVCQMAAASGSTMVDHIDIDEQAVRLCAEHLPYGYTPADVAAAERGDGPIFLRFIDGYEYICNTPERYDIVVVDLPDERDGVAQHNRLYETDFLTSCKALLRPGGVFVSQAGCPTMWRNTTLKRMWNRFHAVFETVAYYGSDEHEWAYLFGRADAVADPTSLMRDRLARLRYQPETIDSLALQGNSVPPLSVRMAAATSLVKG